MTMEELKEFIEERKQEGYSEDEILKIFYMMYADDKITLNDLEVMGKAMGYEFTEEFKAMSDEDKKTKGLKNVEDTDEDK